MVETGNKFHDNVSRLVNWGHWFTFFNIILISLISLRYVAYAGLSDSMVGIAYQFTSLIGHFSFLGAMVFAVILFPLAFFIHQPRLYRLLAILVSTIGVTFLIIDTQIFKLYNFHLNALIWQFLQRPEQVEQIYAINLHYISVPIIFAIELCISFLVWKKYRFLHAKSIGKPIAIFLLTCFIITHLTFIWADATQYRPITQQKAIYPLSYPMTARTFLKKQGWLNDEKLLKRINEQPAASVNELRYPRTPLNYLAAERPVNAQNILLITVDALRADMLNEKNMPFVYQLSQNGLTYTNHFSGASNRYLGIFSLFYALPNRYWPEITLNYVPPVFINRLTELDYQFGLFSSIGFVHPEFVQSSFSLVETDELKQASGKNSNAITTKKWKKWQSAQQKGKKWFSYLHYEQSDKSAVGDHSNLSLTARSEKLALYQQQVLSTDQQIKTVISTLKKQRKLDNTIIVITGTHGASFEKPSSGEALINNAHVPLVVLWPGQENSLEITRMTSHLDIIPTLMEELLGVTTDANQYSNGQSLFDTTPRQYLLSGDMKKYVIYQQGKVTQFSNNGKIRSFDWKGTPAYEDIDVTLLIDVLAKLRHFNNY